MTFGKVPFGILAVIGCGYLAFWVTLTTELGRLVAEIRTIDSRAVSALALQIPLAGLLGVLGMAIGQRLLPMLH